MQQSIKFLKHTRQLDELNVSLSFRSTSLQPVLKGWENLAFHRSAVTFQLLFSRVHHSLQVVNLFYVIGLSDSFHVHFDPPVQCISKVQSTVILALKKLYSLPCFFVPLRLSSHNRSFLIIPFNFMHTALFLDIAL